MRVYASANEAGIAIVGRETSRYANDMSAALRIAVVGVGHLGQHHARLLAAMDGVQLVGIVDTKPGRAAEIASKLGVPGFTHLDELPLDGLDAVTIAVPTVSHLEVALPLIDARCRPFSSRSRSRRRWMTQTR